LRNSQETMVEMRAHSEVDGNWPILVDVRMLDAQQLFSLSAVKPVSCNSNKSVMVPYTYSFFFTLPFIHNDLRCWMLRYDEKLPAHFINILNTEFPLHKNSFHTSQETHYIFATN
jgi:hypothetical protein